MWIYNQFIAWSLSRNVRSQLNHFLIVLLLVIFTEHALKVDNIFILFPSFFFFFVQKFICSEFFKLSISTFLNLIIIESIIKVNCGLTVFNNINLSHLFISVENQII